MKRGFTLIELVLVMLIVAIAMAIVAPSLRGFMDGRKTTNSVAQIVALARHARDMAISEGRTYRLNVDPQSGEYWIDGLDAGNFADLGTSNGQHYQLPDGVKASWKQDENAPVFPVNTINQQSSSSGSLGGQGGGLGGTSGGGSSKGMNAGGKSNQNAGPGAAGGIGQQNSIASSVNFYSDGRNDALILNLDDGSGQVVQIGAYSETERWGVLKEEEAQ